MLVLQKIQYSKIMELKRKRPVSYLVSFFYNAWPEFVLGRKKGPSGYLALKKIKPDLLAMVLKIIKHIIKLPFPLLSLIEPDYMNFVGTSEKRY